MKIDVLTPHGFCAGVKAALAKANALLDSVPNGKVWCLHEIVHNETVVAELRRRGMIFVQSLDEIPEGATVLFSAHGVPPAIRREAEKKRLRTVDATCPFVERVHRAARNFASRGLSVVVIGHAGHAEVNGIVGEVLDASEIPATVIYRASDAVPDSKIGIVSQTTMNADDVAAIIAHLRKKHRIETTAEVCRATKERQDAVKSFKGDAVLVLGSAGSSNTLRLCEVAHCKAFRAGNMDELKSLDLSGIGHLGITSGASTPEEFFNAAIEFLKQRYK